MTRREPVVLTGMSVTTAFGRGTERLRQGLAEGTTAIAGLTRFATAAFRTGAGALLPGDPDLTDELTDAVGQACEQARLTGADRAVTPLVTARHADPATARLPRSANSDLS